jgi:succinoglycan biosynthesis transport protein ExoP
MERKDNQTNIASTSDNLPQLHNREPYEVYSTEENPSQSYWRILWRRKYLVVATFLFATLLMGLVTLLKKPTYRSTMTLQIVPDNPSALQERDPIALLSAGDSSGLSKFYETQYTILSSRPMVMRIIEALKLKDHPEYKELQAQYSGESPQRIEDRYVKFFLENLDIKPLRRTYLVEVSYTSHDKKLAQEVPSALYGEYIRFSMQTRQQSYALIKEWLQNELNRLAFKVENSEKKLYENGQKEDFLSLEGNDNVVVRKYVDLNALLTKAQSDRAQKEAQYNQIMSKGLDAPVVINNELIQKLRKESIAQEAKVASMSKIYDINHPSLQAEQAKSNDIKKRLNAEVQRIKSSVISDYETSEKAEKLLREAVENQKNKVSNLQNNLVEHHILKRDLQTNEQLYQAMMARMKEANVNSSMVASNVAVIAPANMPTKPYSPSPLFNLSLGAGLGLIFGIGMAFVVEYFDNSIKDIVEVQRVSGIPLLGVMPHLSLDNPVKKGRKKIEGFSLGSVTLDNPRSPLAEASYNLRTSIMFSIAGGAPGIIMLTSPSPDEGKSVTAVNLAASLAMHGTRVVLMDADLRNPAVHGMVGCPPQPGLSNFLAGYASKDEILATTKNPNLHVIPAGMIPPEPVKLLSSERLINLLGELHADFDHILIDTPPILLFADARIIASVADGVVLVARQGATRKDSFRLSLQYLRQLRTPVLGSVLTMVNGNGLGGYGYGYKKYYGRQ